MDVYVTAPCIVPVIQQGRVNITRPKNDSMTTLYVQKTGSPIIAKHGEKLFVKCDGKFEPSSGNNDLATCNNGTWTYIPKCEPGKIIIFLIVVFAFFKVPDLVVIETNK